MIKLFRRVWDFLKVISFDTHLWCASVIGGAILLCVSFFVNPIERFMVLNGNVVSAKENTIEVVHGQMNYGSVLGVYEQEEQAEDINTAVNVVEDSVSVSLDSGSGVSVDDFDALCRIVECEAKGEDIEGRMLVANVVLNRVASDIFPNTIEGVIESPGQFDPVSSQAYYVAVPTADTKEAVMRVLNGEDQSQGALYFQKSESKEWGNKTYLFRYNSHSFYK